MRVFFGVVHVVQGFVVFFSVAVSPYVVRAVSRAFAYDASSTASLSEQLTEPVAALKGGLTHLGDAVSSVTAFIPGAHSFPLLLDIKSYLLHLLDLKSWSCAGVGKKSKRSWFSRKSKNT